jgi:hypothetical protein
MLKYSKVSRSKKSVSYGLAAALMASAAMTGAAEARNGGAIAAGIIGGVLAGAVIGSMVAGSRQRQPQRQVRQRDPRQAQRNADSTRVVQQALASMGHYSGPIDGKMAKPTRDGIASFQRSLNDKPTGQLTRKQREVLLAAYAQNQQQGQTQQAQQQPQIDSSLHKLLAGGAAVGAGTMIGAQAVAAPSAPGPQVFLASVCAQGGAPAPAGVLLVGGQPQSVLPDQFCRARNAAISDAARLVTPEMARDVERLRSECRAATEQMSGYATAALGEPIPSITARLTKEFQPLRAQNATDNAINAYKICLGLGYQEDRADMVLASGLGLLGLGQGGHAEVVGAVVAQSPDRNRHAADWLDFAAGAIEKGAPSLDPALGGERATVLRLASRQLRSGGNLAAGQQPVELSTAIRAPSFAVPTPAAPAAAAPQPAPQVATAPATPASTGAERMKGEAIGFFETEKALAPARLRQQLEALRMSEADLERRCPELSKPEDIATGKPVQPQDMAVLTACRTLSYVNGRPAFMMAFDQRLADSGDKDAASRMAFHRLAGH